MTEGTEQSATDGPYTTVYFHAAALATAGAEFTDGFVAPVSGWHENHGDGWHLVEERDVPQCPRLQHRSAP